MLQPKLLCCAVLSNTSQAPFAVNQSTQTATCNINNIVTSSEVLQYALGIMQSVLSQPSSFRVSLTPMQDPVDGSAAVLVQRYNITEQKELELQLSLQQEALQR